MFLNADPALIFCLGLFLSSSSSCLSYSFWNGFNGEAHVAGGASPRRNEAPQDKTHRQGVERPHTG
eukprot:8458767-Alexandrium_andersonii.AAC.1